MLELLSAGNVRSDSVASNLTISSSNQETDSPRWQRVRVRVQRTNLAWLSEWEARISNALKSASCKPDRRGAFARTAAGG
jgi:hypothetical protein